MISVDNPSKIFLSRSEITYAGSAITCIRDDARNLLLEVQALVFEIEGEKPVRNAIVNDFSSLPMVNAVLKNVEEFNFASTLTLTWLAD